MTSLFQTHEVHSISWEIIFLGKLPLQASWALIDGMCKVLILNSVQQQQLGSLVRPWPVVLGSIRDILLEVWNVYQTFKMNKQTKQLQSGFFSLGFLIIFVVVVAEMKLCSEVLQMLPPALYPPPKFP